MEPRTTGAGAVHTGSSVLLDTTACAEPCRAAVAFVPGSPEVPWRVVARVSRAGEIERARLFAVLRGEGGATEGYAGANAVEHEVVLDLPLAWIGRPVEVGVVAVGTGGTVTVEHLAIVPTRVDPVWRVWAALAIAQWIALALGAGVWLAVRLPPRARVVAGVVGALVIGGVLLPRPALEWLLTWVPGAETADLHATLWDEPSLPIAVQKIGGHGGAFALLAVVGRTAGASAPVVLARLAMFAAATELVQLFRQGRSPSFADLGYDLAGALVGLAVAAVMSSRGALRAR
jgi:hypothetical protein